MTRDEWAAQCDRDRADGRVCVACHKVESMCGNLGEDKLCRRCRQDQDDAMAWQARYEAMTPEEKARAQLRGAMLMHEVRRRQERGEGAW